MTREMSHAREPVPEPAFVFHCKALRKAIKVLAAEVNDTHEHGVFTDDEVMSSKVHNPNEMHANISLAYRHLEDAAMRIGKAIQAFDGGKSVYD